MRVTPIATIAPDGRNVGLKLGHVYEVLGIEADSYRILTDNDDPHYPYDPVLFEPEIFLIVDAAEPVFWLNRYGEDGERYAYPEGWMVAGFFEDYHNKVQSVCEQFWRELPCLYPQVWNMVCDN